MKTLMLVFLIPVFLHAENDWSLSLFADGGTSFTNHTDAPQVYSGTITPYSLGPNETAYLRNRREFTVQAGSFPVFANFGFGTNLAWKGLGLETGYRQTLPFSLRSTTIQYEDGTANSYGGEAVVRGFYVNPNYLHKITHRSYFVIGCKLGQASIEGDLYNSHASTGGNYTANFHYTGETYFIEPSVRHGWFINKNYALSLELAYTIMNFNNPNVENARDVTTNFPPPPPNVFGPPPRPFNPASPHFTVDASSFSVRLRLDTFLFNAFQNPPPAPVVNVEEPQPPLDVPPVP